MIPFILHDLAKILNAKSVGLNPIIKTVSTDSRTIGKHCLFVALKGKKFDAHDFASQAIAAGARALLVNQQLPLSVPQLVVANTRLALGELGAWVRQQIPARIVALTGSSGKTSVKEMTALILRQCGQVLATQGNFNNDIGVALTLLNLTPQDEFAVIELGANQHKEISWISNLVRPETALVNNLAAAHLRGFGSLSGVAQAKGEIFTGLKTNGRAIINNNSHDWPHWKQVLRNKSVWRFSLQASPNIDFFATEVVSDQQGLRFILHSPQGSCPIQLPCPGQHNISNALAASALALSVGATLSSIATGLARFKGIPGRLFPIILGDNQLLLDDTYNANVSSMTTAAKILADMPGYRVMTVGSMSELGDQAVEYHRKIGNMIAMTSIDKVLSLGGNLSHLISNISGRGEHFHHQAILIARLQQLLSEHSVITVLVKGSRNTKMEQIVDALKEKEKC